MMLEANQSVPLYRQLYQQLRQQIETGALKVGDRLPSARRLAAEYGICRLTARKAIEMLAHDGYIYVQQGKGAFVIRTERLYPIVPFSPLDGAPALSRRIVSVETVSADPSLAERLGLLPGDKVARLEQVEYLADVPVVLSISWLPYELCAAVLESGKPCASLTDVLEKSLDIPLWRTEETAQAVLATAHELELLELSAPAPLLLIQRTTYAAPGRIVEYARVAYRADYYRIDLPPKLWQ
ncbi:MAG TPA: GntR family transcriptional regulator [Anaerolineae bacterium]|nr:GntR family transcriptional regulator [Anaerolineae bacterium]HQK13778.1 GntR family transcriptional regulator [Anaerolineae bacterium]